MMSQGQLSVTATSFIRILFPGISLVMMRRAPPSVSGPSGWMPTDRSWDRVAGLRLTGLGTEWLDAD